MKTRLTKGYETSIQHNIEVVINVYSMHHNIVQPRS